MNDKYCVLLNSSLDYALCYYSNFNLLVRTRSVVLATLVIVLLEFVIFLVWSSYVFARPIQNPIVGQNKGTSFHSIDACKSS